MNVLALAVVAWAAKSHGQARHVVGVTVPAVGDVRTDHVSYTVARERLLASLACWRATVA